ncbi:MAG TPA: hypothetical protein DDW50_20005 [Firmicutes bacterium]|jgi:hypothetical protein|nr:hypothetical protein [Bacillota bacterium]
MGKTSLQTIASLEQQIAAGKQKLQEAFDAVGCTDSIALAYSIKLDKLINRYQKKIQKMKAKDNLANLPFPLKGKWPELNANRQQ